MIEKRPNEFDDIRLKLFLHVNYLLGEIDIRQSSKKFDNVFFLLDSLLMPTVEYDLAKKRLTNAQRYVRSGEFGGARFELRMVLGWIKSYLDPIMIKTYGERPQKPITIKPNSIIEFEETRSGQS